MPGNYNHTTRADGTTLTAAIYNADHENHKTNMTPAGVDDYSVDLTQSRLQTIPSTLAGSLAGELERLRYILALLGGRTYWDQIAKPADIVPLTNQTGAGVIEGDLVSLATSVDNAVILEDVLGSLRPFVVAAETIGNGSLGAFYRAGQITLGVTGTVTRANYLRKSATSKLAEDTGVQANGTNLPPRGALAIALASSSSATVSAFLLPVTATRGAGQVDNADHAVTGTLVETNMASVSLPAKALGATGRLVVSFVGETAGVAGTKTIKFYFGATSITLAVIGAGVTSDWWGWIEIDNLTASTQRWMVTMMLGTTIESISGYATSAENTDSAVTIKLTATLANIADTLTSRKFAAELVR